jgi:glycosyl transferase, family 25
MSHLAVLESARDRDWPAVLIMEDDLSFHPRFSEHAETLVRELDAIPWGFAYFGHRVETDLAGRPTFRAFRDPLQTTHFYAVSQRILEPLIEFLHTVARRPPGHPEGGPMHVDGAYNMFRARHPNVITVIATPSLGQQRSSASDVTPGWLDQTPGLRHLVRSTRRIARFLNQPVRGDA